MMTCSSRRRCASADVPQPMCLCRVLRQQRVNIKKCNVIYYVVIQLL
jgi:hypothetical protein